MQLRFYARGTGLVSLPGERRIVGQLPRYVGRKPIVTDGVCAWPASEDAHTVSVGSDAGARLMKRCRDGELWPADADTAAACGVPFVPLAFADGAWSPAPTPPALTSRKTPKD